jgi:hypothetical protein
VNGYRLFGLTEAYRKALRHVERPDLADQITEVRVNWGLCPTHGPFTDGLIIRRYGDGPDPVPPDPNDPDTPAYGTAASMIYNIIRKLLNEPPLDDITPDEAKHKHCLN